MAVFGMTVVLGPLAFGAVDRVVQTALVLLLAVGAFLRPPALVRPGRPENLFLIAVVLIFVLKEFAPWQLFGGTRWRTEAGSLPGLDLPWTHHPEPARAFDALLTGVIAVFWLQWVRTLAVQRGMRVAMAWILLAAGVAVAAVSLSMKPNPGQVGAIYGIRTTPGWIGWGPFPNRNHTASLLAMAAAAGLGCIARSAGRKQNKAALIATGGVLLAVVALLVSRSRGGLVAFAVGLTVFSGMLLWKHRNRRMVAVVVGGITVVAVCIAAFGSQVIGRFSSDDGAVVSNGLRVAIWRNAFSMWKDAPFFGHGVESFTQLFPFYQKLTLDDNVVLHPESSWLQWLNELGLLLVALLVTALAQLVFPRLREIFVRRGTFYLSAGAFAGVAALFAHAVIDVPGHRWGTAGFAIALLGLACPVDRVVQMGSTVSSRVALVPLAICAFWALPFFGVQPTLQPVATEQLRARELSGSQPRPAMEEYRRALRYFPLARDLHNLAGLRELESGMPATSDWQRHFEIVHRLAPGSWQYPITHAKAVRRLSPTLCIHYWQVAIARSGWRSSEMLGWALDDTAGLPNATKLWADFVATKPELALAYAKRLPADAAGPMFELWWQARAKSPRLSAREIADFYQFAPRWATSEQIHEWIKLRRKRRLQDYLQWVALLHGVGDDEEAWTLYSGIVPDPAYPASKHDATRKEIEFRVQLAPENMAHRIDLVRVIEQSGDTATARTMVLEAAAKPDAPSWFLRKAAYVLAADHNFRDAVAMVLREK
jgi:O-antigen ligase